MTNTQACRRAIPLQFSLHTLAMVSCVVFVITSQAAAQLIYVEAVDQLAPASQNIFTNTGGPINELDHLDPNFDAVGQVPANNVWNYRDEGVPFEGFATIYESIQEDSPELMVKINSGLTAGNAYDVYVVYWSDQNDWGVRAGFNSNPGANPIFNRVGEDGTTAGTFAGNAVWATPPDDKPEEVVDNPSPFINVTDPGATGAPATQNMFLGLVGSTTAQTGGVIDVFIDDIGTTDGDVNTRSWFDGLAFVPADSTVFVEASIERVSGALTFTNPTSSALSVVSYSVASPAGALDQTQWNEIATGESNVSGSGWTVTSPGGTSVVELAENGSAVSIAGNGGTLEIGDVYINSPFSDITLNVNLSNGQSLPVTPAYIGDAPDLGDFNGDGDINLMDYVVMQSNMFNPAAPASTLAAASALGDITLDNRIDRADFLAFRNLYESLNGIGSFAAMVSSVPEPSTGLLVILGAGILGLRRNRKSCGQPSSCGARSYSAKKRLCFSLCAALLVLVSSANSLRAQSSPVTGWFVQNAATVTNGETNSPTIGNGTANNADDTTIWAALQDPVTLANGEEVVLTGSVQLVGVDLGGGDGIRVGLFNGNDWFDSINNPTYDGVVDEEFNAGTVPAGWSGFLAIAPSGTANGAFDAKNPNFSEFATTNFVSNFSGTNVGLQSALGTSGVMVPGDPNANAKIVRLGIGPPVSGSLVDGTYDFEMRVGKFGNENTMSVKIVSQDLLPLPGDFNDDSNVNGRDILAWQRNQSVGNLNDWETNFGRTGGNTPRYLWNLTATAAPTIDTAPESLIPSEFDRVGLLLSGSQNADQAVYSDITINKTVIQTMLVDIETDTGAMSLRNSSGTDFDITYYEITSSNGNLNPDGWVSLDDGEGEDPVGTGWDEIGFPSANVLGELRLEGSLIIPGDGSTIPIGNGYDTSTLPANRDISFFFALSDGSVVRGLANFITSSPISAVPEPGSLCLLVLSGFMLSCRRRANS